MTSQGPDASPNGEDLAHPPTVDEVAGHFRPSSPDALVALIRDNPLAWFVTPGLSALMMPVMPRVGAEGRLCGFHGHLPLRIARRLGPSSRVLILIGGAAGYISPSWFENRMQAPTWASQSATFLCQATLSEDPSSIRSSLDEMVVAMEAGREDAWTLDELGPRYAKLAHRIAAFEATIIEQRAAFRLCQDDDAATFGETLVGLSREGRGDLVELMRQARR